MITALLGVGGLVLQVAPGESAIKYRSQSKRCFLAHLD